MNYHIKRSKYPPSADTRVCSRLR